VTPDDQNKAVVAWCEVCKLPFAAGSFGAGSAKLGIRGQDVYIDHMVGFPGGFNIQGAEAKCPACGTMGRIQDGLYDTIQGVVRQSASVFGSLTLDEAARLIEILRRRQDDEVDDDAVVDATPAVAKPWVRSVLERVDKKFWIGILLSVLLFLYGNHLNQAATQSIETSIQKSETSTEQQVERLQRQNDNMQHLLEEMLSDEPSGQAGQHKIPKAPPERSKPPDTALSPPHAMPSRNAPCWCGSGRKFKRCHKGAD
jgi:uncharacterized protein YecA (UPF0149 family)